MKKIDVAGLCFLAVLVVFALGVYVGYEYSWKEKVWHMAEDFDVADDLRSWTRQNIFTAFRLQDIFWEEMRTLKKEKRFPSKKWEVLFGIHRKTRKPAFIVVERRILSGPPAVIYSVYMEHLDLTNGLEILGVRARVESSDPELLYREFIRFRVMPTVAERLYQFD